MNDLDLRQLGTIMGLPLYVGVESVRDYSSKKDPISERTKKALLAGMILRRAMELSEEQIKALAKEQPNE